MDEDHAEVVVSGAGPTGLLLAGDLAAAGVAVTVLERRTDESNLTRAFAVHARTLEILDARGLADELISTGAAVDAMALFGKGEVDLTDLPSRFPFMLVTPQYNTENLLAGRALRLGARIVHGAELVGFVEDGSGVDVEVRRDGALSTMRADYLVGADGVGSAVRKQLGLAFPGETAVSSVMLADVRLRDAPSGVVTVRASGDGFLFLAPFGDGYYRVIAWDKHNQKPDTAPVDLAEIRDIARSTLGTDYGMHDPRWAGRFHSDERQVAQYRVGRAFLAGDAAHVHSPAGGQGMNTGLQDAANLGWKLAATVRGWAPPGLLDSYQVERHPVGQRVLTNSGRLLRVALAQSVFRKLTRTLIARVITSVGPVSRKYRDIMTGIAIGYPAPSGAHELVGRRAPDVALAGGGRLYEALRGGTFVLLVSEPVPPVVEAWADRVVAATPATPGGPTILVRPDGYVAWASDETNPVRLEPALRDALTEYCGAPAVHSV